MNYPTPESIDSLPDSQQRALFLYALARARHASAYRHAVLAILVFLGGSFLIQLLTGADNSEIESLLLTAVKFLGVAAVLMGGVTTTITSVLVKEARQEAVASGLPQGLIRMIADAPASLLEQRF